MSTTVFVGKKRVRLDDRDLLGVGGEGRVFRVGDQRPQDLLRHDRRAPKKLAAFPRGLPPRVVGPLERLHRREGRTSSATRCASSRAPSTSTASASASGARRAA